MFRPFEGKRFNLAMVAAIAFGIGFIALGYLNYAQYTASQQSQSLLQGQITDLTYQVKQDHAAGLGGSPSPTPSPSDSPSPTPTPSDSPTPSPSPSTAVLGASTTTIKTPHNVHDSPSTTARVVVEYTSLHTGEAVTVNTPDQNGWTKITVNGATGYIPTSDLN